MRASARITPVLLGLLLLVPLVGGTSDVVFVRHVERTLASPTPLGPLTLADDTAAWRAEIPAGVVVCVHAEAATPTPFWLRAQGGDVVLASPTPALQQGFLLPPGAWTVTLDPAAGAKVSIDVTFEGHYVDCVSGAARFSLQDLPSPCAEACLP